MPLLEERPAGLPSLSIVVPARNEERSIEACVRSLLAQDWVDFELIVVDDRSDDATPQIVERLAREDTRLRVVCGAELPDGWVGKPWALHQGALQARGQWLLFTDADSVHAPRGTASALAYACAAEIDALTIATYQHLVTPAERALLPTILGLVLLACGTFGELNDPTKPQAALANGQYLLVSRPAYDALGGHEALRAEIAEDLAFARRLKADGRFRLIVAAGERLAAVRMYRSLDEIWKGFTKNMFVGAEGNVAALLGGALGVAAISVGPPVLALRAAARGRWGEALEATACTAATVAAASWAFRKTKLPRHYGLYQPLGAAFFAAIALNSTWSVLSGRGVSWRGRRYTGRPGEGLTRQP